MSGQWDVGLGLGQRLDQLWVALLEEPGDALHRVVRGGQIGLGEDRAQGGGIVLPLASTSKRVSET